MALNTACGTFGTTTGVATTEIAVTGLGFTPKVVLFWMNGLSGGYTLQEVDHQRGFGYAVSATDRGYAATSSVHEASPSVCKRMQGNNACLGAIVPSTGLLDGLLDFVSMDDDGFTVVIDDAFTKNYNVHYLAIGGSTLLSVKGGDNHFGTESGNIVVTSVGFTPNFALFFGCLLTTIDGTIGNDSNLCVGAAKSSSVQYVLSTGRDGAYVGSNHKIKYCLSGECLVGLNATSSGLGNRCTFTSFDADGFTLNNTVLSQQLECFLYLCFEFSDPTEVALGEFLTTGAAGEEITVADLPFQPKGAMILGHSDVESTASTPQTYDQWCMGVFTSETDRFYDFIHDGMNSIVVKRSLYNAAAAPIELGGGLDVRSINEDGFTLYNNGSGDPNAPRFFWYITFGRLTDMWKVHPHASQGYLFLLKPKPLLQALVNEAGTITYPVTAIDFDTVTLDKLDAHEGSYWRWYYGATVSLGAAALGREKGLARLRNYVTNGTDQLTVYASRGTRYGELNVVNNDYLTVWDLFQPWTKVARATGEGVLWSYKKDYDMAPLYAENGFLPPTPNAGPPVARMVGSGRFIDVQFNAGDSLTLCPNKFLGEEGANVCSGGTASASTENGANVAASAFDADGGTYWEPTDNADEWIEYNFGVAKTIRLVYLLPDQRGGVTYVYPNLWRVQYYDDDLTAWVDAAVFGEHQDYWDTGSGQYFALPEPFTAVRWRIYIDTCGGYTASYLLRLHTIGMFEDSSNSIYEWYFGEDAEVLLGSTSTAQATVRYPAGFRYAHLSLQLDSGGDVHRLSKHIPIYAGLPRRWDGQATPLAGGTFAASTAATDHAADLAFDEDNDTFWITSGATTGWLRALFPNRRTIGGYKLRALPAYATRALATSGLIGYWKLNEAAGSTIAADSSGNGYNGTSSGVTFGQSGAVESDTAASLDGGTDFINIYSTGLAGAFNGSAGTMMIWAKANAAAWTDGVIEMAMRVRVNVLYDIGIFIAADNNLYFRYIANGTTNTRVKTTTTTAWIHLALTWDRAAGASGEVKAYFNGVQEGATLTGLGDWSGALASDKVCIGASETTGAHSWDGTLAHAKLFNRALTLAEIQAIIALDAAPNDWTFDESADAVTWTTLDTQTNQVFTVGEEKTYTLAATGSGPYFRVNATSNNGNATVLGLAEMVLLDGTDFPHLEDFTIDSHAQTIEGQHMTIDVGEAIDKDDYPDRTLVMYFEDEYYNGVQEALYGPTGRENLKFWGWLDEQREEIEGENTHTRTATRISVSDGGRWLAQLPAFPEVGLRTGLNNWQLYYPCTVQFLNIDRFVWFLLFWNTTLGELCDFFPSNTGDTYAIPLKSAEGSNQYAALDSQAQAIARRMGCDRFGRLVVWPDPMLQDTADRTAAVIASLTEDDILSIGYTRHGGPRAHWLQSGAVLTSRKHFLDTNLSLQTAFVRVPGIVPGQGVQGQEINEQLVVDENELKAREGHRYAARLNPETSYLEVVLAHSGDIGWDPARLAWVNLTLSAAYAAQRGLTFTETRCLLVEVRTDYQAEALAKKITLILEPETTGLPAESFNALFPGFGAGLDWVHVFDFRLSDLPTGLTYTGVNERHTPGLGIWAAPQGTDDKTSIGVLIPLEVNTGTAAIKQGAIAFTTLGDDNWEDTSTKILGTENDTIVALSDVTSMVGENPSTLGSWKITKDCDLGITAGEPDEIRASIDCFHPPDTDAADLASNSNILIALAIAGTGTDPFPSKQS